MARWTSPIVLLFVFGVVLFVGGAHFKNQAATIAAREIQHRENAERMGTQPEGIHIGVDYGGGSGGASSADYRSLGRMLTIFASVLLAAAAVLSVIILAARPSARASNRSG